MSFSLDYSALLRGQAGGREYKVNYGIEMFVSDGLTNCNTVGQTVNGINCARSVGELSGMIAQEALNNGTLAFDMLLQPDTLYSIDIITDPSATGGSIVIPESGTLALVLVGMGVLWSARRKITDSVRR